MSATPRLAAYVDWTIGEALPLWSTAGFDADAGRFHERLSFETTPLAVPYRAMVQARQIYVFAHAAALGRFAAGGDLAERAMAALARDFAETADGRTGFAFSIAPGSGHVVSATRDAYTHAFILFAAAHLHALTGDHAPIALAGRVTAFVEAELVDRVHGGVIGAVPASEGGKKQNPQMHLLEAWLALAEATGEARWLDRADALVDLFENRMLRRDLGILPEHFEEDWAPDADEARATLFEPGHHYEWAWLLHRHQRLTARDTAAPRAMLLATAARCGASPAGPILDEVAANGTVVTASHRLWPHTEAIKAHLAEHAVGDVAALPGAETMAAILLGRFVGRPVAGGWIDRLDPDLAPLVDHMPASSLYHLFLAASEAAASLDRANATR